MSEFADERLNWEILDPLILSGAKLEFLKQVRATTGLALHEALDLLYSRYDALRRSHPDAFSCSHDEYWKCFYS